MLTTQRSPGNRPEERLSIRNIEQLEGRGVMKKILCVDDDSSLLQLYHDELSEEGYEVILAKDGQEALMKFENEIPDVVVMDIRMPRMDGIHTKTTFLGKDRGIQIILNTAHPLYRENFMTWGATAFVIKSSDLSELKQKIREALKNRERLRKT
jgi:DNA-binding NtrC family response regulator